MSASREPGTDDDLARTRRERDDALARLETTKRHLYRRLDRMGVAHERAVKQAEERRQAVLKLRQTNEQLRQSLEGLRRRRIVRTAMATQRIIRRLRRSLSGGKAIRASLNSTPAEPTIVTAGPAAGGHSIAIHIASPSAAAGVTWGDTQFAAALQEGFKARGWRATIHDQDRWDDPASVGAEVALHLFGLRAPVVRPGQLSLLWVISHPDLLTVRRCADYDAVFVASDTFRAELAERMSTPVHTLLQATDPHRFYPDPTGPRHDLLFVGNARPGGRPMIDALSGTTHDLAVYGGRWSPDLLDPRHLRGDWIPNDQLRRYYSSAKIVLNDTWQDMREEGFISNRVFDALACGAFVVSDRIFGMDVAFDDGVAMYDDVSQIARIIDDAMDHPDERRARASRGQAAVLDRQTFAHRVDTIIGVVEGQRADRSVGRP